MPRRRMLSNCSRTGNNSFWAESVFRSWAGVGGAGCPNRGSAVPSSSTTIGLLGPLPWVCLRVERDEGSRFATTPASPRSACWFRKKLGGTGASEGGSSIEGPEVGVDALVRFRFFWAPLDDRDGRNPVTAGANEVEQLVGVCSGVETRGGCVWKG